ncbi:BSD domain-containing protein 1 [Glycine soja]|uniref:BSD domain-containing protein 1 n=1 Tax=Glycine soja TaxID=3848 RepID=A0A0B2SM95_GLYSO|nr:BSD domain-containing protein 1 [Glycine soja]
MRAKTNRKSKNRVAIPPPAKSESIIETYRRDLQEFGTGLKKEIEVAHRSLETVGHVIDQFGNTVAKGTAHITSYLDSDNNNNRNNPGTKEKKSFISKRYSRFDSQVRAIQSDVSTYTEVPEDSDEYNEWKSRFSLEEKRDEMEGFLNDNAAMESVYKRVVPSVVDHDTFWCRYYYRVYRLKKAEDVRARLVRRMSRDEEELSWDVEEEDENKGKEGDSVLHGDGTNRLNVEEMHKSAEEGSKEEKRGDLLQSKGDESVEESKAGKNKEVVEKMSDGTKKNSLVANKHSKNEKEEEEDLEWDEIEDLSRIDEEKATRMGSHTKVDLRKRRLSAAQEQEEEDLSREIEEDDEPANAKA